MIRIRYSEVNAAPRAAFLYPLRALALATVVLLAGCDASSMVSPPAPVDPATLGPPRSIGDVQGRGPRSPYEGRVVNVQGVVTGNFVSGLEGFFMQDASGAEDGDPATSDALFVRWQRNKAPKVRRGDRLAVSGKVEEIGQGEHTLTALTDARIEVLGRAAVSATVLAEAPARAQDWEALEGMWLRIPGPLTVSSNRGLLRYGELQVAFGERLRTPTDVQPPGAKARAVAEENQRRGLVLDDARSAEFPPKLWYLPEPLSDAAPLRAGSLVYGAEGLLDYRYGSWRLQLTESLGKVEHAPRPPVPVLPEGLRLASINLLNYFNGNGRGAGFPTQRGASSKAELERQRRKHVAVLQALLPDIVALSELENDPEDERSAINDLLRALNEALGEDGDYVAVSGADPGRNPVRVGILYRRSRVEPIGSAASLTDGPFAEHSRAPLAQSFRELASGRSLTVVANHFKSKGGCPKDGEGDPGDADNGDGQGCWNATRMASARALDLWLKSDPTGAGTTHRVLLGDFNSYTREDPLRLLRSLGWRDAMPIRGGEWQHHSFVYAGQAGSLDHALLSPSLAGAISAALSWSINSDESEIFDYNLEKRPAELYSATPLASADHDPLVVVLDMARAAP